MDIKKVGVVGCGLMGAGIAQVAAQAGYDTIVCTERCVTRRQTPQSGGDAKAQQARTNPRLEVKACRVNSYCEN
jgi:3-hydroxyacyl-CoA dehydrogenase